MFRQLTRTQLIVDVAVAVLCVLVRFAFPPDGPAVVVVILIMATALALRRVSPGLALAVTWVGAIFQMMALLPPDLSNAAILAVLFTTARYGSSRVRWLGLASAGVGALIAVLYFFLAPYSVLSTGGLFAVGGSQLAVGLTFGFGAALATLGLSWTLGLLARTWANARQSRRDKADAERAVVVEQERNRIARDMHDVVAHSLAVVIAQADGARYARATDPEAVDQALTTISSTAREALADVRLLLGQLRHSQEGGPQPVLADIDRLFDQLRASGLPVRFAQVGTAVTLPTSQQLAIYRIVQEALTNALRHGVVAQGASVRLEWAPDGVDATIANAIAERPEPQGTTGHGLAGMRERALLVGGTVAAEPVAGAFVVHAHIPTTAAATVAS